MNEQRFSDLLRRFDERVGFLERRVAGLPARPQVAAAPAVPCLLKLVDVLREQGGSGGKYVALIASGGSTAKLAGNLAMPEGLYVPDADEPCLALHVSESGAGNAHAIACTPAAPVWAIGLIVGTTAQGGNTPDGMPIVAFATGGGGSAIRVVCVNDYGRTGPQVSVRSYDENNSTPSGEPFDVQIIHHTETGDRFYVVPTTALIGWVQIGFPPGPQFAVLQQMDGSGSGTAQGIDFDYLKGH